MSKQARDKIDKLLEIFVLVCVWVSGFLCSAGLLLSWPHNPLWSIPSLTALFAAISLDTIMRKNREA